LKKILNLRNVILFLTGLLYVSAQIFAEPKNKNLENPINASSSSVQGSYETAKRSGNTNTNGNGNENENAVGPNKNNKVVNSAVSKEPSEKIKQFIKEEEKQITSDFPYRLNLFEHGQIDKNKAGIRIAETANQFSNLGLTGLLFYYKLFDHSMRVPHWHANADEVGVVLNGKMKITIWDGEGKAKIFTVEKNGTWLIPKASLHALENVGESQLEFIVAYNASNAADRDFATAWAALPSAVLDKSLGLSAEDIDTLRKTTNNRLSLSDPASVPEKAVISSPLSGNFAAVTPLYNSPLGSIRRIDEKTTPAMKAMAIQQTVMSPDTLREPHWYTGGDTLLFVTKGEAFFTMMDNEGKVYKAIVKPGDLVFIPIGTFHSFLNIAGEPLEVYEVFDAAKGLTEVTLLSGAQQFTAGTIASATGLSKEVAGKILKKQPQKYMIGF
jgi:oxalate decarboxylase/phosphoglucose isomerase-like protein (cupin superfamily)